MMQTAHTDRTAFSRTGITIAVLGIHTCNYQKALINGGTSITEREITFSTQLSHTPNQSGGLLEFSLRYVIPQKIYSCAVTEERSASPMFSLHPSFSAEGI
jgi:hypothetical protein